MASNGEANKVPSRVLTSFLAFFSRRNLMTSPLLTHQPSAVPYDPLQRDGLAPSAQPWTAHSFPIWHCCLNQAIRLPRFASRRYNSTYRWWTALQLQQHLLLVCWSCPLSCFLPVPEWYPHFLTQRSCFLSLAEPQSHHLRPSSACCRGTSSTPHLTTPYERGRVPALLICLVVSCR